jgi:hypothetical protein
MALRGISIAQSVYRGLIMVARQLRATVGGRLRYVSRILVVLAVGGASPELLAQCHYTVTEIPAEGNPVPVAINNHGHVVDNAYHVVTIGLVATQVTRLSGFTIRNGNADGTGGNNSDKGGGVLTFGDDNAAVPGKELNRVRIINNRAAVGGAGLAAVSKSDLAVTNGWFEGSIVTEGAGGAIYVSNSKVNLQNRVILGNAVREVRYSDVADNFRLTNGVANQNADPSFRQTGTHGRTPFACASARSRSIRATITDRSRTFRTLTKTATSPN